MNHKELDGEGVDQFEVVQYRTAGRFQKNGNWNFRYYKRRETSWSLNDFYRYQKDSSYWSLLL
jgi:hypothetical protein